MELEVRDATIRATDRANNVVEVETVGWDQPAPELAVPFAVDAVAAGRATRLSLDSPSVSVARADEDGRPVERYQIDANETYDFPDPGEGGVLVWVTGRINTWIRVGGPATVEKRGDRDLVVSMPHPTRVTLAFQGSLNVPHHAITVPKTPAGVATALSHFAAAYSETGPARSSVLSRGHPPRIEFGEETQVPERIERAAGVDGVELHLPPTLEALLPAASLATYLGADVTVDPGAPAVLAIPGENVRREVDAVGGVQYGAAALLRRIFHLDTLVRWETESEQDWFEADALSVLDLDPDRCAELPMAARVARYLAVDFRRVASVFPEWTSTVYAAPTYDAVRALPYLANNLTQVYLPDAYPDDAGGWRPDGTRHDPTWDRRRVESLHDPDRAADPRGPAPSTRGPYVGWLGENPPDGVYQVTLPALRHREKYLGEHESISVAVVGADDDRSPDLDPILELYGVDPPPIDLTVYDAPTKATVADCIVEGTDVLHYVGPCRDGLSCADGLLHPQDLPESNARTFFLDGPSSRETGLAMLAAGSVVGAVWAGGTNGPSAAVRENFVRSFVGGMTADFAARYARQFADRPAPLAVVGDGFHELVKFSDLQLFPMEVEPATDGQFRVRIPCWYTDVGTGFGGLCLERWHFGGNQFDVTLPASDVTQLLDTSRYMVVYDGEIYRPEEVTPFDPAI